MHEFPEFEKRFDVNLEVYSLSEDGFARSVYKSRGQHATTMYVNVYEIIFRTFRDFNMYAQKYQCKTCVRHFKRPFNLRRHEKICTNRTKFVYPGGFYRARESIFEQLDQYEICVPDEDRTFPWYVCYDFEALLQRVNDCPTEYLQWTQKHVPISVSICSNVEGHTEPVCLIDTEQDQLVERMVSHLHLIAEQVQAMSEQKWGWVLKAIDKKIQENGTYDDECNEEDTEEDEKVKPPSHPLQRIYGQMETYMSQVPVLGFNSAKYDLNLIKRYLAKHLNLHQETETFVVKKNNAYACIATDQLKFLDITQFLAPGSSYVGFLKAYHVTNGKGFFPYEWFDDVTKLNATDLPPYQSFYSSIKQSNITVEEYDYCKRIWGDNRMETFRDFLAWYNNLDVQPFVEAVGRFQRYYFQKGVDVFKTAISVPGIARQLLFQKAREQNVNFALFDKNNRDLYDTVKQNIVGGPSIIFTRHPQIYVYINSKRPGFFQQHRGKITEDMILYSRG
ncbi:hypothetical protein MAR_016758 [Mya arenaria]|uniref:DNA-directed DNA polymerase n=1 Tax=Mya arenaria TaxID=6604 RepID=A0ABY7E9T6_MYAAR|nr:hypothetical protein MAR_016758 [Mya arenaria]